MIYTSYSEFILKTGVTKGKESGKGVTSSSSSSSSSTGGAKDKGKNGR